MFSLGITTAYAVIATLGPSSASPELWKAMLEAGATAFRLNTSHLTPAQLDQWINLLAPFLTARRPCPALVLDLQGSKWRLGQLPETELAAGDEVTLVVGDFTIQAGVLPVPHIDFFRAAELCTGEIVLNDAKVRLVVEQVQPDRVRARVLLGGPVAPYKGITFAQSNYRSESLSDKDRAILSRFAGLEGVRFAISYVKDAAEMAQYRAQVAAISGDRPVFLIAKLERAGAVQEAAAVAQSADELWVCRGDLGAEIGLHGMAAAVHNLSAQVRGMPVPVVLAGQVLEHMTTHPTPTRSEVCCLYDALSYGYAGFVLSDEAAVGQYPVESCRAAAMFKE